MKSQYVYIAKIIRQLYRLGCSDFVVCPGSRNAPIINFLAEFNQANIHSHIDERSAAYIALGIAKNISAPVAVVCTSGTAALNFTPAMAEAYHQRICLIAITADRPKNASNSFESQAINQQGIFQNFTTAQFMLDLSKQWTLNHEKEFENELEEAIQLMLPLHINMHLLEPLYDFSYQKSLLKNIAVKQKSNINKKIKDKRASQEILNEINSDRRILLFMGFNNTYEQLGYSKLQIPILVDPCSPNYMNGNSVHYDFFLGNLSDEESKKLQPNLLITSGTYMLSKQLRNWLKSYPPKFHIHIGNSENFKSPFTEHYCVSNGEIDMHVSNLKTHKDSTYFKAWMQQEGNYFQKILSKLKSFNSPFYSILFFLLGKSENNRLHCGNSMAVRYAALFQSLYKKYSYLICNRGTSGIDGCTSTFMGYTAKSTEKEWLLVGDISFFYDCNAFWLHKLPKDFVMIVVNNSGGKIFDAINGPEKMKRRKLFISNPHKKSVKQIAALHSIRYHAVRTLAEAKKIRYEKPQRKIIEVFDNSTSSIREYKSLYH